MFIRDQKSRPVCFDLMGFDQNRWSAAMIPRDRDQNVSSFPPLVLFCFLLARVLEVILILIIIFGRTPGERIFCVDVRLIIS
jgi:hypothetical protein